MSRQVISIDLPYACFGIIVEDGQVVEAAPIAKWATGKSEQYVVDYFRRKGAKVEYCAKTKDRENPR